MKIKMRYIATCAIGVAVTYHLVKTYNSKCKLRKSAPKNNTLKKKPRFDGWEQRTYIHIK